MFTFLRELIYKSRNCISSKKIEIKNIFFILFSCYFSQHNDCVPNIVADSRHNTIFDASNVYPMVTRSKSGIFQPKTFVYSIIKVPVKPRNYKEAMKN